MNYNFEEFGKRVSAERKALGLSQSEFLNKLHDHGVDMGRTSLSMIESGKANGNTTLDVLNGLCAVFDCEMGYLLGEPGYTSKTRHTTKIAQETGLTSKSIATLKKYQSMDSLDVMTSFKYGKEYADILLIPVLNCLLESPSLETFLYNLKEFSECEPGSVEHSQKIGTMFLTLGFLSETIKDNYPRLYEEYGPFMSEVITRDKSQLEKQVQKIVDKEARMQETASTCSTKLSECGVSPDIVEEYAKNKAIEEAKDKEIRFNTHGLIKMVMDILETEKNQTDKMPNAEIPADFKDMTIKEKLNVIFKSQNESTIKKLPKGLQGESPKKLRK